jgi:hypothetical protein
VTRHDGISVAGFLTLVAMLAACRSQPAAAIPWHVGRAEHLAVRGPKRPDYPFTTRIPNMELRSPEGGSDGFGTSTGLGVHTAAIGAPGASGGGAVWVMDPQDPSKPWTRLEPPVDPQVIGFGESVAVSPDGRWIAVGAPRSTVDGMVEAGQVFLWERVEDGWKYARSFQGDPVIEDAHLGASLAMGVLETPFGSKVRLSWTLMAGAPRVDIDDDVDRGVVLVWDCDAEGRWKPGPMLKWTGARGSARFGQSVSIIMGRNLTASLVGAPGARTGRGHLSGGASVFTQALGSWREDPKALITGSDLGPSDQFGAAVSIGPDVAVVGATEANLSDARDAGRIFVFRNLQAAPMPGGGKPRSLPRAWMEEASLISPRPMRTASFGSSVAIAAERIVAGSPEAAVDGTPSAGVAFTFRKVTPFQPSDPKWMPESELRAREPAVGGRFGDQVDLIEDYLLVSEPRPGSGVVHLFIRANDAWGLPIPGSEPASATEATTPQPETASEPAETGAAPPATPATSGQVPLPV